MTTSTTSIDIMGLQAAYANLHTDQERDYFMQRYHDVISSFGGKTSYDAESGHLLVMRLHVGASGYFFFSSRRRHTRSDRDWSLDVCSSDLGRAVSPLDMATAYATLADSGTRCDPKYVSTATDGSGRPMNLAKTSCRQVLDPRTADTVKIGRASCRERV